MHYAFEFDRVARKQEEAYHRDDRAIAQLLFPWDKLVAEPSWREAPSNPIDNAEGEDTDADEAVPSNNCQDIPERA